MTVIIHGVIFVSLYLQTKNLLTIEKKSQPSASIFVFSEKTRKASINENLI